MTSWTQRRSYAATGREPKPFNARTPDSDFQRDRARIIHSAAFRRLQAKTQVLGVGEHDFYRTRLTHSLEVAQIGFGISELFRDRHADQPDYAEWIPSQCGIEAVCLGHDIGHPPFGHGGEVALNFSMRDWGGFEGNGQTLRITARLGEYSEHDGYDLTRRTLLGLLKYPALFRELAGPPPVQATATNLDAWRPPKCVLDSEADVLDWILEPFDAADRARLRSFTPRPGKPGKTLHKPFDTTIMDVADDISYGVHDFEDAVALGLIGEKDWQEIDALIAKHPDTPLHADRDFYRASLFSGSTRRLKHAVSKLVEYFKSEVRLSENADFTHPLLRLQATMPQPAATILEGFKTLVMRRVILSPEVQTLEYKGQQLVVRLFEVLRENPQRLLPAATLRKFEAAEMPERVVCDYLAGMTDSHATRTYHKLFSPEMGSVFDRL
ncbi:MAG TPA: anti-phage deoxyguanosine triphosphatase [Candidatus Krumholzibacteria bacterium]|nr:anti-phage deoxyguanosine triphosphatase [Candidatus Krumholzibacteria bacterium]HRX50965.1 anti-phage deoxyguanosine triphosphatase [Candidatus Krumholzibacteria bacterium]